MDILDILIAKKKSFTGETETLVNRAKKAMNDANDVIERVSEVEDAAEAAAASAADAAEEWAEMREDITSAAETIVDNKLAEMEIPTEAIENIQVTESNTSSIKSKILNFWKKGQQTTTTIVKNYTTTGQNEDGGMTQKAITNAVNEAKGNFGSENEGKIVIVGEGGTITPGDITEDELKDVIENGGGGGEGTTTNSDILGVIIDYENKSVTRCEDSIDLNPGNNFNKYIMYGGRKRCNVNASGEIVSWYGDNDYSDNGLNGDVMIYQPKFYYKRIINKSSNNTEGVIVKKETLLITEKATAGFKIHPRFKDEFGMPLEYILLPAYEGSVYDVSEEDFMREDDSGINFNDDYLVSRAGSKPVSGQNNDLTITNAEKLATNKGEGWHITDMGVESINQMLFIIEYASLNAQSALGLGISKYSTTNYNNAVNTGLTASLGNNSGEAPAGNEDGKRAVSYRGYENGWGNIWCFIGGFSVHGDNNRKIGIPYIATSFTYDPINLTNYESLDFSVAPQSSWVSGMGYGNAEYDWVYFPAETTNGNSAVPVGDNFWTITNFTQNSVVGVGGTWAFDLYNGLFYYGCDRNYDYKAYSYNARIMFIPAKDSIYVANYQSWLAKMGG